LPDSLVDTNDENYWPPGAIPREDLEPEVVLRPALGRFKALLSQNWSPDTAYPGTVTHSDWFVGNPRGQCGVSSVWLAEVLAREYSIDSTFCRGSLIIDDETAENLFDHCWLEISGRPGDILILDLTCDQAQGFDRRIVFDANAKLEWHGVHYLPREQVEISDLPSNPVWPRYTRLLRNMVSPIQAPTLGR
jgi:hypothetical protein